MSSILTNNGAMVALNTLRNVNSNLNEVQSQISTGKEVNSAKDNAAVFAISQIMESDVIGFKAVSESLNLGKSTLAVGANAAKSVNDLLNEIKGKIVSANEDNVDRDQLQTEIVSLRDQITSVVGAAQFNGFNLVDGSNNGAGGFSVLASIDRDSAGNVTSRSVGFDPADTNLSTTAGTALVAGLNDASGGAVAANSFVVSDASGSSSAAAAEFDVATGAGTLRAVNAGDTDGLVIGGFDFQTAATPAGGAAALDPITGKTEAGDLTDATGILAGDTFSVTVDNVVATYTVAEGDQNSDISSGLRSALLEAGLNSDRVSVSVNADGNLALNNLTSGDIDIDFGGARASGGLSELNNVDVSTEAGAAQALGQIDTFIQTAVDAQARIGTTERRLEIQEEFMVGLIDTFNSGIGSLVDTNMEEASARLQALQVQQQLATQSLSMANQAPQSVLSLFG